jgi:hypothetical protein
MATIAERSAWFGEDARAEAGGLELGRGDRRVGGRDGDQRHAPVPGGAKCAAREVGRLRVDEDGVGPASA